MSRTSLFKNRIDLFISFHGGETLRSGFTTRQLARETTKEVIEHAKERAVLPSIFFDEDGTRYISRDILSAILQTRGGGLGLIFLTESYFRRPWCVTELLALLDAREKKGRNEYNLELRFICLGVEPGVLLKDPVAKALVPDLSKFSLLSHVDISTLRTAAIDLAELVWKVWNGQDGVSSVGTVTVLGNTRELTFMQMQKHFWEEDMSKFRNSFGLSGSYQTVDEVFQAAVARGIIGYDDLDALSIAITHRNGPFASKQQRVVKAYRRKWVDAKKLSWEEKDIEELERLHESTKTKLQKAIEGEGATVLELDPHGGQAAASVQKEHDPAQLYTVKRGDTMWKIAEDTFGSGMRWKEIHQLNGQEVPDPHVIYPGQILRLPQ